MRKKLTYIQRAYKIEEFSIQLDAICEDDHKKISDYSQEDLVSEAEYCLDTLTEDLYDDPDPETISYKKKQIKMLEKYIDDFS